MVSLKDIAKECGVSIATVSKALNDQHDVGEGTKIRIREKVKEMGYFPNAAARALKTKRSFNIGVLFQEETGSGLKHEYFSGVLNGFKMQAESMAYDITFINTSFESTQNRFMSYYEHCKYRNLEGIVIVCADYDEPNVIELMKSNLPVVTIDYVHYNCTDVSSNNVKGMEELLNYIYEKGHRKIAYIHGQDNSYVTKERMATFFRMMEEFKIDVPEEYMREAAYLDPKKSAYQTNELLNLTNRPTCILYPDDTSLIGGRNVITEQELRIPEDISVAGYDGILISQLLHPKITTIGQDTEKIGREAAKRLIRSIENPKTTLVERVVIEGVLLPGHSVSKLSQNNIGMMELKEEN